MASENQPFWALAGVVVGFFLSEGSRYVRERIRIFRLKRAIHKELESIKSQIPQKQDIVAQIVKSLENKVLLPGESVPIISLGYNEAIKELYVHLCPNQRNCLHVIYARLRIADERLISFLHDFISMIKDGILEDPWKAFADQLREINSSYDIVLKLITSYLSQTPIDVFESHPLVDRKT
jgi:hypothetical protein